MSRRREAAASRTDVPADSRTAGSARPLIAIPARFSATTSALRYAAEVNARALVEAVWRAGGEPTSIHPAAEDVPGRLARLDGVLLPGGGDLAPRRYGATDTRAAVYDVDDLQDSFDPRGLPRPPGRRRRPRRHPGA